MESWTHSLELFIEKRSSWITGGLFFCFLFLLGIYSFVAPHAKAGYEQYAQAENLAQGLPTSYKELAALCKSYPELWQRYGHEVAQQQLLHQEKLSASFAPSLPTASSSFYTKWHEASLEIVKLNLEKALAKSHELHKELQSSSLNILKLANLLRIAVLEESLHLPLEGWKELQNFWLSLTISERQTLAQPFQEGSVSLTEFLASKTATTI